MNLAIQSILILLLFGTMLKSADWVEDALIVLSKKIRISPFIAGFVLLSLASSLPEFSVVINSASAQIPDLSVGNLLGATLFLLSLVLGVFAIRSNRLPFSGSFGIKELLLTLTLIALHPILLVDGRLSLVDGLLMVSAYILLISYLTRRSKDIYKPDEKIGREEAVPSSIRSIGLIIIGVTLLLISSNFLVRILVDLTRAMELSETVIGLFLLGIGTNLPEISIALRSNTVQKSKVATGNLIGSALTNILGMGLLGVLAPHKLEALTLVLPVVLALLTVSTMFGIFAFRNKDLTRMEGVLLLCPYLLLVLYQLLW